MRSTTLIRVAGKSILKNKMRTLLTMLGIIIGVGAVIMMVAIGVGAQRQIEDRIQSLGTNMIVVTPGSTAQGGVSQGAQTFNHLTLGDADMLRTQSFLLSGVSPVIITRGHIIGGGANWRTWIFGVSTDYQTIRDWQVQAGVFFSESDVQGMRKVALIGQTVADNLFPGVDAVGQRVQIRDVPFEVIGVLERKGQTAAGSDQDDVILAPYTTIQNRLAGHMFIGQILASTFSPGDIPAAQEEMRAILRQSHGLGSAEADDFTVRNQSDLTEAAEGTTRIMTILLSAIASVSLLVGGIGIMNIMLVSVTERTREIGLRLAIGARSRDVLRQFLVESVVISLAGGAIGVAVGFAGSALLGAITGWSTAVSAPMVLLALVFAGVVGVFFGYYPARRAASLDPIQALRYE
jgi:putative ABC transport system permease protein